MRQRCGEFLRLPLQRLSQLTWWLGQEEKDRPICSGRAIGFFSFRCLTGSNWATVSTVLVTPMAGRSSIGLLCLVA